MRKIDLFASLCFMNNREKVVVSLSCRFSLSQTQTLFQCKTLNREVKIMTEMSENNKNDAELKWMKIVTFNQHENSLKAIWNFNCCTVSQFFIWKCAEKCKQDSSTWNVVVFPFNIFSKTRTVAFPLYKLTIELTIFQFSLTLMRISLIFSHKKKLFSLYKCRKKRERNHLAYDMDSKKAHRQKTLKEKPERNFISKRT